MKSVKAVVVLAGCLICLATQGFGQEDDSTVSEIEQRKQISQQAAELLRADNFAELEKTAEGLRNEQIPPAERSLEALLSLPRS